MLQFKGSGALTPCPTATTTTGHMDILPGFKLCRKGLHQYPIEQRTCPVCRRATAAKYRERNRTKLRELDKKWKVNNIEKARKSVRNWAKNNKERKKQMDKLYYKKNKERVRKNVKTWTHKNRGIANSLWAKRRAKKRQAIPQWASQEKIKAVYKNCAEITRVTGIKHEVDHVYPLQSKYMCGLHVETNLQIITKKENNQKYNSTWPGQLDCQKGSVYDIFPKELTDLLDDEKT
jgi:hypothetical protein